MTRIEPAESPDVAATIKFREAYLATDRDALRELMTHDSFFLAAGAGRLLGATRELMV